jgi:hypothetical protein
MIHFLPGYSTFDADGSAKLLCFKVKGKNDNEYVQLLLRACDEMPELCPVLHLLIYIYLCNITEGYSFPDLDDRSKVRQYGTFLMRLTKKFKDILSRDAPLTTHCFRKTGYLFAVWGGGTFQVIAHSARHEDEKVAMGYHKDAEALKMIANQRPNPLNKVPNWSQIRIVQTQGAQLVRGSQETDVTLYEIAQRFMRYMKLGSHPAKSNTIQQITSAA